MNDLYAVRKGIVRGLLSAINWHVTYKSDNALFAIELSVKLISLYTHSRQLLHTIEPQFRSFKYFCERERLSHPFELGTVQGVRIE